MTKIQMTETMRSSNKPLIRHSGPGSSPGWRIRNPPPASFPGLPVLDLIQEPGSQKVF